MESPFYNYDNDDGHYSPDGKKKSPIGKLNKITENSKQFQITPAGIKKLKTKNENMEDVISEERESGHESLSDLSRGSRYIIKT